MSETQSVSEITQQDNALAGENAQDTVDMLSVLGLKSESEDIDKLVSDLLAQIDDTATGKAEETGEKTQEGKTQEGETQEGKTQEGKTQDISDSTEADRKREEKRRKAQNRFHDITKQNRELREKLAELQAQLQTQVPQRQEQPAIEKPVKPTKSNFDDDETYLEAMTQYVEQLTDYKVGLAEAKAKAEAEKASQVAAAVEQELKWRDIATQGRARYGDFVEAASKYKDVAIAFGGEVAYVLGKNPELVEKLMGLQLEERMLRLAHLQGQLEASRKFETWGKTQVGKSQLGESRLGKTQLPRVEPIEPIPQSGGYAPMGAGEASRNHLLEFALRNK